MAITNETGDGTSWEATVEMREDGDGTDLFWPNTIRKLLNRTRWTYDMFVSDATMTGAKVFDGDVTMNGLLAIQGTAELTSAMQLSTGGRIIYKNFAQPDGNATLDIDYDIYFLSTPTANRTYTLRSSTSPSPVEGEEMEIVFPDGGAFTIDIQREGGASIVSRNAGVSGMWSSAKFAFSGGSWRLVGTSNESKLTIGTP